VQFDVLDRRVHGPQRLQIADHPIARNGLESGDVLAQREHDAIEFASGEVTPELVDDNRRKPFDLLGSERVK
jgi:hypothetical protein